VHPAELRKLHALLVIDTRSGLGESVKVDGENIDHLLSNRLPKNRADIVVLTGSDVNADAILAYYRRLGVGSNDALLFYYAGHGATDPQKGQFLALQDLAAKPLLRSDLKRAMQEKHPGLVVILTDCCGTRYHLPNKTRRLYLDKGTASAIDPFLKCLLYQSRGEVDITAASGNTAFGDDHEGGIFTRAIAKLIEEGIAGCDANKDGFVTWPEFFSRLSMRTQGTFVTWAEHALARGEDVDQSSQKPMAFSLGSAGSVRLQNMTATTVQYEYRWPGETTWHHGRIAPHAVAEHAPPAGAATFPTELEIRLEGKILKRQLGKMFRFHGTNEPLGLEKKSKTGR
jgi:hypothetical protein